MTDNDDNQESRRLEEQDLEAQQQDLFRELAREQVEAEQAAEQDQEEAAAVSSPQKVG